MLKFVLLILFLKFIEDVEIVNGRTPILTKQQRFIQKKEDPPELSEDGDDAADEVDMGDDAPEGQVGGYEDGGPAKEGSGKAREAKTEENLRLDAWSIFRNLDEFMIVENQRLMDALYGNAIEQNEEMEEIIYDLTDNIDHWSYKIYSKFVKTTTALQDSRFTSAKTAIIAIDSQIRKATQQLKIFQGQLYRLEDQLPDEEEQCTQFYTCKECLSNENCGWCPLIDKCVVGDENGPLFDQCQHYNYQFCQGKQCLKYEACNTCLSDPDCGWCQVDEDSIRVCLQQPYNFKGCPEGNWYHIAGHQFSCPFKKKKEIIEEDVPDHKFWMRPKQKPPACQPVDEQLKKKIQKERQQYNDKSEYKAESDKKKEVQLNYKQTMSQKVAQLKVLIEELTDRKDVIQAYIDEYMAQRGIEDINEEGNDEQQDQDEAQQQEDDQNQEQQQQGSSPSGGGNVVQVKKEKKPKKKIVQVFYEEQAIPEEQQQEDVETQDAGEEAIEQGEEDVEYVFETSKEYKVEIGEPYHKNKVHKKIENDDEDLKYNDQGDRDVEGEIDYKRYINQRKRHFSDFQKYYPQ